METRENYVYLAFTANFWGRGETEAKALAECKRAGGSGSLSEVGYVMYHVEPETYVNEMGGFTHKVGHTPVKLYEKLKGKAKRKVTA